MKNIALVELDKYTGNPGYRHIEGNIYESLEEKEHVFAFTYELEQGEDSQYPLEDLLDRFFLYVSDFVDEERFNTGPTVILELAGSLEDVRETIRAIIGKRVFNKEHVAEDGHTYVTLAIE